MKVEPIALPQTGWNVMSRIADYVELTKPRIAVMVLVTVAAGGLLASRGEPTGLVILHAIVGTALVASGASILNQAIEVETDAMMARTAKRPLPSGRISRSEALVFGIAMAVFGTIYLALLTNPLTAWLGVISFVLYVLAYTPIKRYTSVNTIVGAVPGALPPVIGWAAVTGHLDPHAWDLFLVLFFWQFPHFLAIAWLYREDYARAGLKMLPTSELGRRLTGVQALSYCLVLLPISLLPYQKGSASEIYLWTAVIMGIQFLWYTIQFVAAKSDVTARRLVHSSLIYLPVLLGVLMFDHLR